MVDELERRGAKRGLVTMCAGGGMARQSLSSGSELAMRKRQDTHA